MSWPTSFTPSATLEKRPADGPVNAQAVVPKQPRRELCYEKCSFCRKDKKKCVPGTISKECQRCLEKGFPCSVVARIAKSNGTAPLERSELRASPSAQSEFDLSSNLHLYIEIADWFHDHISMRDRILRNIPDSYLCFVPVSRVLSDVRSWLSRVNAETVRSLRSQNRGAEAVLLQRKDSRRWDPPFEYGFMTKGFSEQCDKAVEEIDHLEETGFRVVAALRREAMLTHFLARTYCGVPRQADVTLAAHVDLYRNLPGYVASLFHQIPLLRNLSFPAPRPLWHNKGLLQHSASDIAFMEGVVLKGYSIRDEEDCFKRTTLHFYFDARIDSFRCLRCLVDWHVPLNAKDIFGRTALHIACTSDSPRVNDFLALAQDEVEVNVQDVRGRTPLAWAAASGNFRVVELLLNRDDIEVTTTGEDGMTPLMLAEHNKHWEIVRLLRRWDDGRAS